MCLDLNKNYKLNTAKKDMVVFKHIRANEDGTFQTTYQDFPIVIGKTYSSLLTTVDYICISSCKIGLHSFKMLSSVKSDCDVLSFKYGALVLVECIIPKGSHYYVGKFGCDISYASDTLKYVRIVGKIGSDISYSSDTLKYVRKIK